MDEDTRRHLLRIAADLEGYAAGGALPKHRAAAWAAVLQRLTKKPSRERSEAERKGLAAALSYEIRCELEGPRRSKKVSGEVRAMYGYRSDQTVVNMATKWRRTTTAWLSRLDCNIEYKDLTRGEMLKRELVSIEN